MLTTGLWSAGDSRAVLCRSGVAIPLTDDHKAAREDETVSCVALCHHTSAHLCALNQHEPSAKLLVSGVIELYTICLRRHGWRQLVDRSCSGTACGSWACWLCPAQLATTACALLSLPSQRYELLEHASNSHTVHAHIARGPCCRVLTWGSVTADCISRLAIHHAYD